MDPFVIAGREFTSRLIIGTGKYPTHQVTFNANVERLNARMFTFLDYATVGGR